MYLTFSLQAYRILVKLSTLTWFWVLFLQGPQHSQCTWKTWCYEENGVTNSCWLPSSHEWTSYQGTPKATSQAKLSFQQFTASSHTSKSRKNGRDVGYKNFRCCIQHHTLREIQFIKPEATSSLPFPVFDILGIYAGKTKFL